MKKMKQTKRRKRVKKKIKFTKKTKIVLCIVLIVLIVALGFFSKKKVVYIDPIDDNTYTIPSMWVWEDDNYNMPSLSHSTENGDCLASGLKKIKTGISIFKPTVYEIQFEIPEYKVIYEIDGETKTINGKFSMSEPFKLEVGNKTKSGKTIIGWYLKDCYNNNPNECEILTELHPYWIGDTVLVPAYAPETNDTQEDPGIVDEVKEVVEVNEDIKSDEVSTEEIKG